MSCAILVPAYARPSWNAKLQGNRNGFMQETFWHKVESISMKGSSDIVICMLMLIILTAPGGLLR